MGVKSKKNPETKQNLVVSLTSFWLLVFGQYFSKPITT